MLITGAKKSDSGSGGSESSNTLKSVVHVNLTEAIGEGVIYGFVDQTNPQKSVYFDQTPLMNSDGTLNFQGCVLDYRLGLSSQDPLPGCARTATPFTVEQQIKVSTGPVVRTITDASVNSVQVVARMPAMAETQDNGDIVGSSVAYAFDRRASGGAWEEMVHVVIVAQKCTSPYPKASSIDRPAGTDPWDIRMRRISADSTSVKVQNDCFWESYAEIVKGQYTYDDTAVVNLKIDASLFGSSIGARSYHVRGLIIDVPSNYDPITRIYTGIWDGTFIRRWTNNPVWIFNDLVRNSRYGLGEFISASLIDKWSLYQIGRYCDELIPSGFKDIHGADILEPRFTWNGVINTRMEAYKVLQDITATFRGMAYWSLGQVLCSADMPQDPVSVLTPSNVIGGHFKYSGTAMKARHSVAVVTWNDPGDMFRPAPEVYQNDDQLRRFGYRATEVTLKGCTSRGQAHRFAKWIVETEASETDTVQFAMSWDGYVLQNNQTLKPGDIVLISDPRKNGNYRAGGRLAAVASTSAVTLDQPFVPDVGVTYTLTALLPNGTIETKTISSFSGGNTVIALSSAFSLAPLVNADWIIQSVNFQARRFRVMAVVETEKNIFTVTALFNDPTKYGRIEDTLKLDPVSYVRPRNIVSQVINVTANEGRYFQNGVSHSRVSMSWTPPNDFLIADFMVTADTPRGFQSFPATTMPNIDFDDAVPGNWVFYISARSVSGRVSTPVTFNFTVQGWEAVTGPVPTTLVTTDGGNNFAGRAPTITWVNTFPANYPVFTPDNVVRVYTAGGTLLRTQAVKQSNFTYTHEMNVNDGGPRRSVRIDVTAKSITGIESAPASITVTNPVPALVAPVIDNGIGEITVAITPVDNDYAGVQIWVENNNSFDPTTTTPKYDGPDTKNTIWLAKGTWYVRVGVYDAFGKVGLNISAATSIVVSDLTDALAAVGVNLADMRDKISLKDGEDISDAIGLIMAQITRQADENDSRHQTVRQTLSLGIDNANASIVSEQAVRLAADSAEATARLALTATVNSNTAALVSETAARVSADSAEASARLLLAVDVGTNTAAIATETTARSTADSAIASSVTTLSTTVSGNTASISTVNTSLNGVKVQYGVIGTINGITGGFVFTGIQKLDGSVSYVTEISGNLIVDGTIAGSKITAGTVNGDRIIAGTLDATKIIAGSINTTQLAVNSVDISQIVAGAATNIVASGDQYLADTVGTNTIITQTITVAGGGGAGKVLVIAMFRAANTTTTTPTGSLTVDGGASVYDVDYGSTVTSVNFGTSTVTYALPPNTFVYLATGLSDGVHTFRLRTTRSFVGSYGNLTLINLRR